MMPLAEIARIDTGAKSLIGSYGTFGMIAGLSTMTLVLARSAV
jgi:hypothetical protein